MYNVCSDTEFYITFMQNSYIRLLGIWIFCAVLCCQSFIYICMTSTAHMKPVHKIIANLFFVNTSTNENMCFSPWSFCGLIKSWVVQCLYTSDKFVLGDAGRDVPVRYIEHIENLEFKSGEMAAVKWRVRSANLQIVPATYQSMNKIQKIGSSRKFSVCIHIRYVKDYTYF